MKILHVLYSGLGGHGNVFFSMVKGDVNKEMEYEALFYGIEDARQEYLDECKKNGIAFFTAKKKQGLDIGYYKKIVASIRASNPDIVFLHGSAYILPAKIAGYLSKKKYTIIVRETQANHLKTNMQWITLAVAMQLADKIVCLTNEFNAQIRKKISLLYHKKKVVIIPNGIDLSTYKPTEKNIANSVLTIGMQSRIVSIKDHITLLKAFSILKKSEKEASQKLTLKIAGDGELKNELINITEQLGISGDVVFTGMLNEEQLTAFLGSLDIYVHASLGETMSTAIMQAMACGLPIIASDVSGINNMITDKADGILVQAKNEQLLATALSTLINDPQLRKSLGQKAFTNAVNNYSNQTMFRSYRRNIFKASTAFSNNPIFLI
jgi:glycosyltransferase involved in cell wall biosynthesis